MALWGGVPGWPTSGSSSMPLLTLRLSFFAFACNRSTEVCEQFRVWQHLTALHGGKTRNTEARLLEGPGAGKYSHLQILRELTVSSASKYSHLQILRELTVSSASKYSHLQILRSSPSGSSSGLQGLAVSGCLLAAETASAATRAQ